MKYPSSFVVVLRRTANCGLSTVTAAFGTSDLPSSATTPLIEAVICCAWTRAGSIRKTAASKRPRATEDFVAADIIFPVGFCTSTRAGLFRFSIAVVSLALWDGSFRLVFTHHEKGLIA